MTEQLEICRKLRQGDARLGAVCEQAADIIEAQHAALQEIEFKLAGALPPYCRDMALKAIAKAIRPCQ